MTSKRQRAPAPNDRGQVGYGRPPAHTQFKAGVSGNPTGRPKNARSFRSDMLDELSETTTIKDGGLTATVTKQRALAKRLVSSAVGGDAKAMNLLVSFLTRMLADTQQDGELSAEDHEILASHDRRTNSPRGKTNQV